MLIWETEKQSKVGGWSQAAPLKASIPCGMRGPLAMQTCSYGTWHNALSCNVIQCKTQLAGLVPAVTKAGDAGGEN